VLHGIALESALQQSRAILESLEFASRDTGVVLLNEDFSILYANKRGRAALGLPNECDAPRPDQCAVLEEIERHCEQMDWTAPEFIRDRRNLTLGSANGENAERAVRIQPFTREGGGRAYLLTTDRESDASDDSLLDSRMELFGLTMREQDIARLVARGYANSRISDSLCISIRTTENHLRSIYSKVGVNTRSQLIYRLYTDS
jgi:DNA-binding CsgD family transcriptional regulator